MIDLSSYLQGDVKSCTPAFAIICRAGRGRPGVEVLGGEVSTVQRLADLRLPEDPAAATVAVIPYRQVTERGYACVDDGTPMLELRVTARGVLSLAEAVDLLPDDDFRLTDGGFDIDDPAYAQTVRDVQANEIGSGEGSNFVIKRSFLAKVENFTVRTGLAMFRRLLKRELGTYWTFFVHTGDRTLIGATPERHVSVLDRAVWMNPVSGTYRYPSGGPSLDGVLRFLADRKEADELYMVLDEELKMMARICDRGGRVIGPRLKEMAELAHTEYDIEGHSSLDLRSILRETMFAPTVTGSPVENAYRVIKRHERRGRGYYSGVLAYLGHDRAGRRVLDSSIIIRTADIDQDGRLEIGVGSTLVRHSDPAGEVAETRSKVAGLLGALDDDRPPPVQHHRRPGTRFGAHPSVRAALAGRNATLARYWLRDPAAAADAAGVGSAPALAGRRALVIDAEDTFTAMLTHQLRSLGLAVAVHLGHEVDTGDVDALRPGDLVIVGPGPGDPRDDGDPRIAKLLELTRAVCARRLPLLAICLGHQVLRRHLGLPVVIRSTPNQGVQQAVNLFGRRTRVGFYNTFVAMADADRLLCRGVSGAVEISRDPATGEVYATRGRFFRSLQFHPESILSEDGVSILAEQLGSMLAAGASAR